MNNGAAMDWGIKNFGDKGKCSVGPNTSLDKIKEALSKIKRKERGIREEEKEKRKRDGIPQRASHPGLCKINY